VILKPLKSNRWSTVNCLIGFIGKLAIACLASLSTINLGVITGCILRGRDYRGIVNNVLLHKGLTKLKS
jgi:hypothetical protein